MDAMDRVTAEFKPTGVFAALRLLEVLEDRGRIRAREADEWRRKIVAWMRFNEVEVEAVPKA
jgi:hypothetical protein